MRKVLLGAFALFVIGTNLTSTPARSVEGDPCTEWTRACMVEVARTYIYAQGGLTPRSETRAAPNAQRWENGVNSASGREALTGGAAATRPVVSPRYVGAIAPGVSITPRDITNEPWVDEPSGQVFFRWFMDVNAPTGTQTSTAHILERVKVVTGEECGDQLSPCITEIEAMFCIGQTGEESAHPSPRPVSVPVVEFLCHRSG